MASEKVIVIDDKFVAPQVFFNLNCSLSLINYIEVDVSA